MPGSLARNDTLLPPSHSNTRVRTPRAVWETVELPAGGPGLWGRTRRGCLLSPASSVGPGSPQPPASIRPEVGGVGELTGGRWVRTPVRRLGHCPSSSDSGCGRCRPERWPWAARNAGTGSGSGPHAAGAITSSLDGGLYATSGTPGPTEEVYPEPDPDSETLEHTTLPEVY